MSDDPLLFSALQMDRSVLIYGGQVQLVPLMSAINKMWPGFDLVDLRAVIDNPHEYRAQTAAQLTGAPTLVILLPPTPGTTDEEMVAELLEGRLELADGGKILSPDTRIIGLCLKRNPAPAWIERFPFRLKDAQALALPKQGPADHSSG